MSGAFQASAFQHSAFQVDLAVTRPVGGGGVGRGGKRKKWVLGERTITATREELEAELEVMLETAPEVEAVERKVAPKDRQIVAMFPAYPDLRDMFLAAREIEAAQVLRAVAARLAAEEDERDIEILTLYG